MYNINKRKQFNTVGDLKKLLDTLSDDTKVVICGDDYCWFHIEEDKSVVCLDCEDLDECYEEDEEYISSSTNGDYSPSNPWDSPGMCISDFIKGVK